VSNWRLTATVTELDGHVWMNVYVSERDALQSRRFTAGFVNGFAHAHNIRPEQISIELDKWIDFDDGHYGGYPHWCKVEE
jgi:hypothetical protein